MTKTLFLVDGSALAYRSYFAFSKAGLINHKGIPTGAIFGFVKALLKIMKEESPEFLAVVWDARGKTFRHKMYEKYKANRPKMPEDLSMQMEYIEKSVKAMGIPFLKKQGYEADDIIGTMAKEWEKKGDLVFIVSGDKDFMQLVSPSILLYTLNRFGGVDKIGSKEVVAKFGVNPDQIRDFLGLMGDASDNVPGVPGVGKKTAQKLLVKWGTIEEIIQNAHLLGSPRLVKSIQENEEILLLSQKLVTIDEKVPLEKEEKNVKKWEGIHPEELSKLFGELGFSSLMKTAREISKGFLAIKSTSEKKSSSSKEDLSLQEEDEQPSSFQMIQTYGTWKNFLKKITKVRKFAFQSLFLPNGEREGLAFAFQDESYFVDLPILLSKQKVKIFEGLQKIFSSSSLKIGYHLKKEMLAFKKDHLEFSSPFRDLKLEAYLLHPSGETSELLEVNLLAKYISVFEIFIPKQSKKKSIQSTFWEEEDLESKKEEFAKKVALFPSLANVLEEKIQKLSLKSILEKVEIPLISILVNMESTGIYIDVPFLKNLAKEMKEKLKILSKKIYELAGEEFNINSSKQMAYIIFEKLKIQEELGIKKIKKTQTGYSTNHAVLESLSKHLLPRTLLEYRSFHKLLTTYLEPLPGMVNEKSKRIHSTFHQTITATGRLSSSNPNLQNIPIRSTYGEKIRQAFVPMDKNSWILSADYSQIELRILAHFSKDPALVKAFQDEKDIHKATASGVFRVPLELVTSKMRSQAKAVNFGIIYGMGPRKLSVDLGMTLNKAKEFIEEYFELYDHIKAYLDGQIGLAKKTGKVSTLLGRHRFFPHINSPNGRLRSESERMAINTPIQGSASDIIKLAMIHVQKKLMESKLEAKMILQVHDELIFEVKGEDLEETKKIVQEEMEQVVKLQVPLKVDVGVGKNWLEAH